MVLLFTNGVTALLSRPNLKELLQNVAVLGVLAFFAFGVFQLVSFFHDRNATLPTYYSHGPQDSQATR